VRLEVAVSFWFLNRNLVVLNLNPVVAGEIKKKIKIMIKKPESASPSTSSGQAHSVVNPEGVPPN